MLDGHTLHFYSVNLMYTAHAAIPGVSAEYSLLLSKVI